MSIFKTKEPKKVGLRLVETSVQPARSEPFTLPPIAVVESKASGDRSIAVDSKPAATTSRDAGAYLDAGSRISGRLYFGTAARIDGQVDGEINSEGSLSIGEGAVVAAQIKARSLVVSGAVSGDIVATHRIEIRASARVLGNIVSPTLVIQDGALFEGHCAMQPEAQDEREVTLVPTSA
jgi:cytoskeletal protein CcmA (bactofilin family)